jgi:hypothetical protein
VIGIAWNQNLRIVRIEVNDSKEGAHMEKDLMKTLKVWSRESKKR